MLRLFLRRLITTGDLSVVSPSGRIDRFGDKSGPPVIVRCTSRATALKIALHPDLYLGETFMDGSLRLERGTIAELLDIAGRNLALRGEPTGALHSLFSGLMRRVGQINTRRASKRNVAHHYDLSEEFYRSFLDSDMQYSCAYFETPDVTLEEAQRAKKAHIAAKLKLEPGMRVLDIGCGWGGLALYLAQHADVTVHGISLSKEQLRVCAERARALGLESRVTFEMADYRDLQGIYDRVVSVGMFEHVGTPKYDAFFHKVSRLLTPSGVALIHSIGRAYGPSYTSGWIRKYIFPGGYAPALSQVVPAVEGSGLWITDIEILRLHYAETLDHWRQRFLDASGRTSLGRDPRFARMWEFYLAASEMSFRHCGFMNFQIQLARCVDALPLSRRYIGLAEDRMAANAEGSLPQPTNVAA